jgi:hypothetical protein
MSGSNIHDPKSIMVSQSSNLSLVKINVNCSILFSSNTLKDDMNATQIVGWSRYRYVVIDVADFVVVNVVVVAL